MMVMQFGQFVDHDIAFVPFNEELNCCTDEAWLRKEGNEEAESCFTIEIPANDSFAQGSSLKDPRCQNFVRSNCAIRLDCSIGPAQQVSQITSWLDNSNVYGSEDEVSNSLRYDVCIQLS